jgi:lipopolysaccharide transport system ATP-binding protein
MTKAVTVRGLGKVYDCHREQYKALRDVLSGRTRHLPKAKTIALNDVSFDVPTGQILGVVGGNGAGKSTLFKVMARVTAPTYGEATLHGRLGALLEVGAGFHPELTGRENVMLNGSILGMSRREIESRFDDIVEFSEIRESIDEPVKQYSVGMYMRLAFAVAAHLEPDILLVDEVLAVGDARFQEKCLNKVRELGRSGRTLLFISHQLDVVRQLCDRCVLLRRGNLVDDGTPDDVISAYLRDDSGVLPLDIRHDLAHAARNGSGEARIEWVELHSDGGVVQPHSMLRMRIGVRCRKPVLARAVAVSFATEGGVLLADLDSRVSAEPMELTPGSREIEVTVGPLPLNAGRYRLSLRLANPITTRLGSGAIDHLDGFGFVNVEVVQPQQTGPVRMPHSFQLGPDREAAGLVVDNTL